MTFHPGIRYLTILPTGRARTATVARPSPREVGRGTPQGRVPQPEGWAACHPWWSRAWTVRVSVSGRCSGEQVPVGSQEDRAQHWPRTTVRTVAAPRFTSQEDREKRSPPAGGESLRLCSSRTISLFPGGCTLSPRAPCSLLTRSSRSECFWLHLYSFVLPCRPDVCPSLGQHRWTRVSGLGSVCRGPAGGRQEASFPGPRPGPCLLAARRPRGLARRPPSPPGACTPPSGLPLHLRHPSSRRGLAETLPATQLPLKSAHLSFPGTLHFPKPGLPGRESGALHARPPAPPRGDADSLLPSGGHTCALCLPRPRGPQAAAAPAAHPSHPPFSAPEPQWQ